METSVISGEQPAACSGKIVTTGTNQNIKESTKNHGKNQQNNNNKQSVKFREMVCNLRKSTANKTQNISPKCVPDLGKIKFLFLFG